jgi:anti-sigma factor RsiW
MPHPNQDRLLSYTAGTASEQDAERIISHLDQCEVCEERVVALRTMRDQFEETWESFLAEARHRASIPRPVRTTSVVEATVRGWLARTNQLATAAVERLTASGPAAGLQAAFAPVYSGVANPEASAAAVLEAEAASEACGRGDNRAAEEHLRRAAAKDREVSRSAGIDLKIDNRTAGRVVVDAGRGSISVLVYPDVLGSESATAVFLGAKTRREILQPVEGATYLLAEFEDVPEGAFSVHLEIH